MASLPLTMVGLLRAGRLTESVALLRRASETDAALGPISLVAGLVSSGPRSAEVQRRAVGGFLETRSVQRILGRFPDESFVGASGGTVQVEGTSLDTERGLEALVSGLQTWDRSFVRAAAEAVVAGGLLTETALAVERYAGDVPASEYREAVDRLGETHSAFDRYYEERTNVPEEDQIRAVRRFRFSPDFVPAFERGIGMMGEDAFLDEWYRLALVRDFVRPLTERILPQRGEKFHLPRLLTNFLLGRLEPNPFFGLANLSDGNCCPNTILALDLLGRVGVSMEIARSRNHVTLFHAPTQLVVELTTSTPYAATLESLRPLGRAVEPAPASALLAGPLLVAKAEPFYIDRALMEVALRIDPTNLSALNNLEGADRKRGQGHQTTDRLRDRLLKDIGDGEAAERLGDYYFHRRFYRRAAHLYALALRREEEPVYLPRIRQRIREAHASHIHRGLRLKGRDLLRAERAYRELLRQDPDDFLTALALADLLGKRLGRTGEAYSFYETIARQASGTYLRSEAHFKMALVFWARRDLMGLVEQLAHSLQTAASERHVACLVAHQFHNLLKRIAETGEPFHALTLLRRFRGYLSVLYNAADLLDLEQRLLPISASPV